MASVTGHRDLHTIIQVLDDSLDQVFSTSQLVEMIECSKNLKLLQQSVKNYLLTSELGEIEKPKLTRYLSHVYSRFLRIQNTHTSMSL